MQFIYFYCRKFPENTLLLKKYVLKNKNSTEKTEFQPQCTMPLIPLGHAPLTSCCRTGICHTHTHTDAVPFRPLTSAKWQLCQGGHDSNNKKSQLRFLWIRVHMFQMSHLSSNLIKIPFLFSSFFFGGGGASPTAFRSFWARDWTHTTTATIGSFIARPPGKSSFFVFSKPIFSSG